MGKTSALARTRQDLVVKGCHTKLISWQIQQMMGDLTLQRILMMLELTFPTHESDFNMRGKMYGLPTLIEGAVA